MTIRQLELHIDIILVIVIFILAFNLFVDSQDGFKDTLELHYRAQWYPNEKTLKVVPTEDDMMLCISNECHQASFWLGVGK